MTCFYDPPFCVLGGELYEFSVYFQGRSQDFSKGEGGHTVSNIIVMAFSPRNIVGCFLKKALQRGGGGGSRVPQDPPRYALDFHRAVVFKSLKP